jgi:hypothetical protein
MIKKTVIVAFVLFCVSFIKGQSTATLLSSIADDTSTKLYAANADFISSSPDFGLHLTTNSASKSAENKIVSTTNSVIYKWCGALTPNSIKINAKLTDATLSARAVVSTSQNLSNPRYSKSIAVTSETNNMGSFTVKKLKPNTDYFYGIQSNSVTDTSPTSIGKFKTPQIGAHSYSFITGACNSNSSNPVWQKIKEKKPSFMLVIGDFHYANPNTLTESRTAYEDKILNVDNTRNLFNEVPLAVIWDDHDFAGDNSNSLFPNKDGARKAYREYIPHYPFGDKNSNPAIYQSFVIGRVKYILMDLRSEKTTTTIYSDTQLRWFQDECLLAKKNKQMIAWISSYGLTSDRPDSWGGNRDYLKQRNIIFNFLTSNKIENLFIISGDAHMAGIDDGENTDCTGIIDTNKCKRAANSKNPVYPLLQSAPLYVKSPSQKGIITNVLPMTGDKAAGQYTKVDVVDDGGDLIQICFTVYRVDATAVESQIANYCFKRNLKANSTNSKSFKN